MVTNLLDARPTRDSALQEALPSRKTENGRRFPWLTNAVLCAGLAVAYFIAGKLGLRLALVHASATAVWPPAGIALAALLILGHRVWPGVFLGALLTNLFTAGNAWTSLGIAAGNTLEAATGAWMINRWANGRNSFDHPQGVIIFGGAALLSAAIAATLGPLSLALGGFAAWARYGPIWFTWWLGDASGDLVVAPFLVLWANSQKIRWTRAQALEMGSLLLALFLVGQVVFSGPGNASAFLCWPIFVWAALRFGARETATALFLLSWIGLHATMHGHGPFTLESANVNLAMLQAFLGVCNGVTLVLAADVAERQEAKASLQKTQAELEQRVTERTAALLKVNADLRRVVLERQKIEQDLRRLAAIVEYSQDAIIGLDLAGVIQSWNPAAETLFGYSAAEVLGRSFTLLEPPDAAIREETEAALSKLRQGQGSLYETRRVCKKGIAIDVSVCVSPIQNEAGAIIGFSKIVRDIRQHKQMEHELERKTEQLLRSNAELNLFASAVSHELQEPVRKIVGFGDMTNMQNEVPREELDQYVSRMKNAATRMQRLIEGLLSMSRVTTQTKPLEPVALNDVLQDAASDFSARIEQEGGKMEIGSLPVVMADGLQMRQLFQNLISNAYKFRKKGEPSHIEIFSRPPRNGFVDIVVKDDSIGFDEQYLDRIFKPFQRLHRRGEYEGSGLGLAICERIVMRHGGTITAKSAPGKGSSFIVTLPASV